MRIIALIVLLGIMTAIRASNLGTYDDPLARTMIGFGFLIFTGMVAGGLASRFRLPKITGYLFAGMLCGPHVLGLIDIDVVQRLRTVDDLALALIAFTAGGELRIDRLTRAGAAIASVTALQTILVFAFIGAGTFVVALFFGPFAEPPLLGVGALALFFGLIAAANSPATAVAVIVDTKARGAMTEQVVSVTVLKDIVILVLSAAVLSVGGWMLEPAVPLKLALVGSVLLKTALSLAAGGITAAIIIAYVRLIRKEMVLFVVAVSLLIVYESETLGLHFPLQCMTAGFLVENFSSFGDPLIRAVERTSMTVYVIFFAIAGATIDFSVGAATWIVALAFVALRAAGFAGGTAAGAKLAGAGVFATRYGWSGYLGQAGISLGIASLLVRNFPQIGTSFYTIVVASIAINQIIGPIALQALLGRAGETEAARMRGRGNRALHPEAT